MKVLFPFVGDSLVGSHNSILELYRELCKNDIPSCILIHQKGQLSLFLDDIGIKYEYLPIKKLAGEKPNVFLVLYNVLINFNKIYMYLWRNEISVVHGNDLRINLTWSFPTKLSRASYVWHQRTVMSSSYLWNVIYFLADYFITISRHVHETLPNNISESNKKLVLNPFDTTKSYNKFESRNFIESTYSIPKDVLLVGYIGRLVEWKNVDFLIKCFLEYSKHCDCAVHMLIVGTGRDEYVSALKKLANTANITFAGFNNRPNKIISGFDVLVAPSNIEPFGRTLVESMIQKTPIIAARGGGHLEIIKHRTTGWLYDHGNTDDFIMQINEVINECKIVENVVKRAYKYACLKFSSTEHVKNIINIYNQLR